MGPAAPRATNLRPAGQSVKARALPASNLTRPGPWNGPPWWRPGPPRPERNPGQGINARPGGIFDPGASWRVDRCSSQTAKRPRARSATLGRRILADPTWWRAWWWE